MSSGKTDELRLVSRLFAIRQQPEWKQKDRDRSLRGKARRKARKAKA